MEKIPPIEYWDQVTADAYRAAYYAERQRYLAELALSGQLELDFETKEKSGE